MPHVAHGIFGLGLGVATATDARCTRLRYSWLGIMVLLAYLPDITEWVGRMAGSEMTRSAPASLLVIGIYCAVVVPVLVLLGKTTSPILLGAAVVAIASHLVLDLIDGGIPVWWPFSKTNLGPNWLHLESFMGMDRVMLEVALFGPMLAIGLLIWIWRSASSIRAATLGLSLLLVLFSFWAGRLHRPWWVVAGLIGLILVALSTCRPAWNGAHVWQLVPALPVLLLAAVHVYTGREMGMGEENWQRKDYDQALLHFDRGARFVSISGESPGVLFKIAFCRRKLGDEQEAYRLYRRGLEKYPTYTAFHYGLAELFLTASDPDLHRPQEVFRLAEEMVAHTDGTTWETKSAAQLVQRAKRALEQQHPAVSSTAAG